MIPMKTVPNTLCNIYLSQSNRYCNGTAPKGYIDPDSIEWLQPEDFIDDSKQDPMFIDDGPAPNDVK